MKEITPAIVEDAALFSNFAQRVKIKYWDKVVDREEWIGETDLDEILLLAWEDFNIQKKPDKRNPEIQSLWEYGLEIGFTETKQNLQRFALKRLLSKQPPDKLRTAAEYATTIKSDRYAPQVNSWLDLEDKYLKLRDYVARQKQNNIKTINLDVL